MQPIANQVFVKMGPTWVDAVNTNLFPSLTDISSATALLARVRALQPNASLVNGNNTLPWPIMTINASIAYWLIQGISADGAQVAYDDIAASLIDRETSPNPFLDGAGGTTLALREYPAEAYATFYWTGGFPPAASTLPGGVPAHVPVLTTSLG